MIEEQDYGVIYSQKYDASYNANTGDWLEKKCDDPECEFCANRPKNALNENDK